MLARTIVARSVPRVFAARYSTKPTDGSVAQSKPFGKKEKAHEDEYIHRREVEELAKLRKQVSNLMELYVRMVLMIHPCKIEKKKKELVRLSLPNDFGALAHACPHRLSSSKYAKRLRMKRSKRRFGHRTACISGDRCLFQV
ncbi:hypothetical protein M378DRAFT_77992 [Amanita muscaria Koide BX008]|uniref:ATPase inhibitor, mitochondrial n=1 Tax=Amanita muscaria (strain Koide BX008) TaxID=946122 RepID=A0A0C2X5M2_AMAMK|nr:hypothetical protein M378DRAFT_77992 [Amanita muscaria Koide BX008]